MSDSGGRASRLMVVGIGNPDRGDDGFGALVVKQLEGRLTPDVALLARAGDLMSLIEEWAGIDALVCVDATAPMGSPGRVFRLDVSVDEIPRDLASTSSHGLGLPEAVALARTLGTAPGRVIVYAVEAAGFEIGAPMTPAVAAAAGAVADLVAGEVRRLSENIAPALVA
ncbi:MAG: hydrogenase maturation protease [Devosia sp.]|nr:hydrogenase maturation protease [Devosia sp.]